MLIEFGYLCKGLLGNDSFPTIDLLHKVPNPMSAFRALEDRKHHRHAALMHASLPRLAKLGRASDTRSDKRLASNLLALPSWQWPPTC